MKIIFNDLNKATRYNYKNNLINNSQGNDKVNINNEKYITEVVFNKKESKTLKSLKLICYNLLIKRIIKEYQEKAENKRL